jgi:diaminopimelate decarboxylase
VTKERPRHPALTQFAVSDNCLEIGGRSVAAIAQELGQTPFYVYERKAMTQRVAQLRQDLPAGISLHYAMKANPMPEVVAHLASLTDGLDVASVGELDVALATGTPAVDISFAGPGKSQADIKGAVAAGVIINLESESEMRRVAAMGEQLGRQPLVSVRVNPDFELKTSGMKMGGGPKPFGIDAERVPAVLASIGELELDFRGFHIFSGSQNLRPEALIEAQTKTFELAWRLADAAPRPPRWLNIGGGFGIPYFPGERSLPLNEVADNLAHFLDANRSRLPEAEVVIELGRYLVGEAGAYVCEVIDRKESRGETFLVTNGGLHHHLAVSGNFGQVIRKNYPVCLGQEVFSDHLETVSVVGPLCTPLDILADRMELPHAEPGDLVVVMQSGAYGYSASPHQFLSHPPPLQILV